MDKIHIQFKESDYKIYHGYCSKYFESHDTLRKQSIHAFLDLYEKGIIPVEEQDISTARSILQAKCEDIRRSSARIPTNDDAPAISHLKACSDLLVFCNDVEKIFRILTKQPVGANYLMILGTFSRILDENQVAFSPESYRVDADSIEALARPLADCIRERIGPDRHWRSVLRELTFIAARFNHLHAEHRFDLDVTMVVAPFVISRFYKDVDSREILSALPAIFEESDLEEFEAFLDRTPDAPSTVQSSDIDWNAIIPPLKVLTDAMATQRGHGSRDLPRTPEATLLITSYGLLDSGTGSLSTQPDLTPMIPPADGVRRLDVTVSPYATTQVTAPVRSGDAPGIVKESPYGSLAKYPVKQYMPVIIGIAVIIIFIVGTLMITTGGNLMGGNSSSGGKSVGGNTSGWNLFGDANSTGWNWFGFWNNTNATMSIKKNTTPTKATVTKPPKVTAKPTTKVTIKVTATPAPKAYSSTEVGNHLLEIAFGPTNSKIVKANKSLMSISLSGSSSDSDIDRLNTFIETFNLYSATTKIATNLNVMGKGDIPLVFMPDEGLAQINPDLIVVQYRDVTTGAHYLVVTHEKTYINSDLNGVARNRWLLRGVLVNMGFYGETVKYPDSLFYAEITPAMEPSMIDWKAIQLMYGTKVNMGMTKAQVKALY